TDILQTDRIQHAGGSFKQTWRRVAGHGLARQPLDYESAQALKGNDVFKLHAIAKCAAGGDDRVLQHDAGHVHTHVQRGLGGWSHGRASGAVRGLAAAGEGLANSLRELIACVSTWPVELVGLLIPRSTANVGARSIGSTWSRYTPGLNGAP